MAREGARWGWDGPPVEAYERVSDPERFRGLHAAGRELLAALAEEFDVTRERFLDRERPVGPEPAELLKPSTFGAASFGLTFTEAPGVQMWVAGRRHAHLPVCACDACDESMESSLQHLHSWTRSTVGGSTRSPAWQLRSGRERACGVGTTGIVRFWRRSSGWGVVDSPETPGGCWAGFSALPPRRAWLEAGQAVLVDWHEPGRWETGLGRHLASNGETPSWLGWPYQAARLLLSTKDCTR